MAEGWNACVGCWAGRGVRLGRLEWMAESMKVSGFSGTFFIVSVGSKTLCNVYKII